MIYIRNVESIEYVYGDVQVGVEFGTTFEWVGTGFVEQLELNQPSTRFKGCHFT